MMKNLLFLPFFVLLALILYSPASLGHSGPQDIGDFLQIILKAKSLEEIGWNFDRSAFPENDSHKIETAAKKSPYLDKLLALKELAKYDYSDPYEAHVKKTISNRDKKKQLNKRADSTLKILKGSFEGPQEIISAKDAALTVSAQELTALTIQNDKDFPARINSLSPETPMIGERLTISGKGFTSYRGKVELIIGQYRYSCPISRWDDKTIIATIPEYLQEVANSKHSKAILWIKPGRSSRGPAIETLLNPMTTEPIISSLSSREVIPGSFITLEGRNFGQFQKESSNVEFIFGDKVFQGIITAWTDRYISVGIPNGISGLRSTDGYVQINNIKGKKARHSLYFIPDRELVEISTYRAIDLSGKTREKIQNFQCFEDFVLQPGWVVKSFEIATVAGRGSHHYQLTPVTGTTRIHNIISLKARPFTYFQAASRVVIEGPKGTPYRKSK